MIEFGGQAILLDIEGTTSSIRFVYDEMFPLVRRELDGFLAAHGSDSDVVAACQQVAIDAGLGSLRELCGSDDPGSCRDGLTTHLVSLMDSDSKTTGLKQLQGIIWRGAFQGGQLRAHVYDDVPKALTAWRDAGLELHIYSSGSIEAQKLFFGHTVFGDLLGYFQSHYDTTIGNKKERASYEKIANAMTIPAPSILFLSDVVAELDAAKEAGMATGLSIRPGNPEQPSGHGHATFSSFAEVAQSSV